MGNGGMNKTNKTDSNWTRNVDISPVLSVPGFEHVQKVLMFITEHGMNTLNDYRTYNRRISMDTVWFPAVSTIRYGVTGVLELDRFLPRLPTHLSRGVGVGRSSGGRELTCKGLDHLIDPAQRMHLQLRLFCVPTNGPQLVHQRLW